MRGAIPPLPQYVFMGWCLVNTIIKNCSTSKIWFLVTYFVCIKTSNITPVTYELLKTVSHFILGLILVNDVKKANKTNKQTNKQTNNQVVRLKSCHCCRCGLRMSWNCKVSVSSCFEWLHLLVINTTENRLFGLFISGFSCHLEIHRTAPWKMNFVASFTNADGSSVVLLVTELNHKV
jgi:hypothetical protein